MGTVMFVSARSIETGEIRAFEAVVFFRGHFGYAEIPERPGKFAEINLSDRIPEWRIFPD